MPGYMVDGKEIKIKKSFEDRYRSLLKDRYDEFIRISLTYLRRSIRINTLKADIMEVKASLAEKGWILEQIPWCKEGFWIEHESGRRDIGCTREHALGYIYVQEAASMIPPLVLDPKPGEMVLDMCAAPGSKSSQISAMMKDEGLLIANDFKADRLRSLSLNVQRMGMSNAVVTLMFGQWFRRSGILFDRILVDAPCSGTGTIRKSFKTLRIWNETAVDRLAATQKKLITTAFDILKPGGRMVYSTCTLEPQEDEGIISYLLGERPDAKVEKINIDIKRSPAVTSFREKSFDPAVKDCLRIFPQDNDTEGFFVTRISREDDGKK